VKKNTRGGRKTTPWGLKSVEPRKESASRGNWRNREKTSTKVKRGKKREKDGVPVLAGK